MVGREWEQQQRLVVPVARLGHSLSTQLFDSAAAEYGFCHKGGVLAIPCAVDHLRHVRYIIDRESCSAAGHRLIHLRSACNGVKGRTWRRPSHRRGPKYCLSVAPPSRHGPSPFTANPVTQVSSFVSAALIRNLLLLPPKRPTAVSDSWSSLTESPSVSIQSFMAAAARGAVPLLADIFVIMVDVVRALARLTDSATLARCMGLVWIVPA
ncbi:hypothetical protein OPV22_007291 [Ensete ventricosum]|uniref:Uncharacterized protein n=1 Tax=Ensete ventricosum TaxID=4639 RepID=A0AAV8RSX1_ENSVE|nr:hypothetical protein OPV22_007291 [Ensete ventricosum]